MRACDEASASNRDSSKTGRGISTAIKSARKVDDILVQGWVPRRLGRPLTATEKILANPLRDADNAGLDRGVSYTDFDPDRVARQDATAQMALLQFMTAGLDEAAVPTTPR